MTNQTSMFEMVIREEAGNTAAPWKILPGVAVKLFALYIGYAAKVGTATGSKDCATSETEAI